MEQSDIVAQVIYLSLLGLLLAAGYWTRSRSNWGQTAQHAAIWSLIFIAVIASFGIWDDLKRYLGAQSISGELHDKIEIRVQRDGHYYLDMLINNKPIKFVIDTGATDIVLSTQDAARIGIMTENLSYLGQAFTANGVVETASITLDTIQIGEVIDRDVRAVVSGGELFGSLLGMGYLQRWGKIEISQGFMTLTR